MKLRLIDHRASAAAEDDPELAELYASAFFAGYNEKLDSSIEHLGKAAGHRARAEVLQYSELEALSLRLDDVELDVEQLDDATDPADAPTTGVTP